MCLFDTNTSGFTEELTKAPSTTENRWKKRGKKRQCYWCLLTRENERRPLKAEEKYQNLELQIKKKSHKSDLRLYELKTTNKVFLKNRITAFLFSTMRNYTVVQKKKKRTCSRTNSIHTSHTVESTPSRIYLCTTSKKGRGKKLRPFLCVCFVAFRTRYRKKKETRLSRRRQDNNNNN